MTKQIILIFAVLCSVQVQANSRYTERDTVQHEFFHDATELFQPLQPVYLDGVVVPRTGSGNLVCQCHRRCNRFSRNASWLRRSVGRVRNPLQTLPSENGLLLPLAPAYITAVCNSKMPGYPRKITIASMQTCYGTCLFIGIPDRSRHAGDLPHLSESD